MKTLLPLLLAAFFMVGCQNAHNIGLGSRAGVSFGADASICQPLMDQVAVAQTAIGTCVLDSDCVLTSNVPASGYSCVELGVTRGAVQTGLMAALQAFQGAGCNAHQYCPMIFITSQHPCVNNRCVDADSYTN